MDKMGRKTYGDLRSGLGSAIRKRKSECLDQIFKGVKFDAYDQSNKKMEENNEQVKYKLEEIEAKIDDVEVYEVGLLTVLEKAKKELDEEKKRKRQQAQRKNFKIAEVSEVYTDEPDNCYACSKELTCRNPYCNLKPEPVIPPV